MTKTLTLLTVLTVICTAAFAGTPEDIYPRPARVELTKGHLKVSGTTIKCDHRMDSLSRVAVSRFAAGISVGSGRICSVSYPMGIDASVEGGKAKGIFFLVDNSYAPEEYSVSIGSRAAVVKAAGRSGWLNAMHTLRQLLPESVYSVSAAHDEKWELPCCEIHDKPQNSVRALLLPCSGSYLKTSTIKACLDEMARCRMNRLVWEIGSAEGWRLESASYPLIAQVGAGREYAGNGGYYTAVDVREVCAYAASLGISVVPTACSPAQWLPVMRDVAGFDEPVTDEVFNAAVLSDVRRMFGGAAVPDEAELAGSGVVRVRYEDPSAALEAVRAAVREHAGALWSERAE